MTNTGANVERFWASVAKLTPRQWVSIMSDPPVAEYERVSAPGRQAIAAFAEAPTDLEVASAVLKAQTYAPQAAQRLFPDLTTLRNDMRPYAASGTVELSPEMYATIRAEASRRVVLVAVGLALADQLTPAQLAGLMRPIEGIIPASAEPSLPPQPQQLSGQPDLGAELFPLRVAGVAVGAIGLAFLLWPHTPLVWFVLQAGLIAVILVFPSSRIAALASGAWLVYFWVPIGAWVLEKLGVLR